MLYVGELLEKYGGIYIVFGKTLNVTERKNEFISVFCFHGELVPIAFVLAPAVSSFTLIFIKVGDKSAGVDGEFSRSQSKF